MDGGTLLMGEPVLYNITTRMEKQDYRKFLYFTTFRKTPAAILSIVGLSTMGAVLITLGEEFSIPAFLLIWVLAAVFVFVMILFKVERKYRQRVKTDRTGVFESDETITFYEDYFVVESAYAESTVKVRYDQLYGLIETADYLIFYSNANMASLIRKKDMESNQLEIKTFLKGKFVKRYKRI